MLCLNFFMGGSGRRATYPGSAAKPLFVFICFFLIVYLCLCVGVHVRTVPMEARGIRLIAGSSALPLKDQYMFLTANSALQPQVAIS